METPESQTAGKDVESQTETEVLKQVDDVGATVEKIKQGLVEKQGEEFCFELMKQELIPDSTLQEKLELFNVMMKDEEFAEQIGTGPPTTDSPELDIPPWLERMLDNTSDETRVIAYVLFRMGPKNSKIWNEVIKWLEIKTEPFQQGDFADPSVDEGVIREWLAVYNVMGICSYE